MATKTRVKQRNQVPKGAHGGMQLVLLEDVMHLGKQGDLVEVKSGFGRNYLVPRGFATVPTAHNLRLLDRFKIRVRQARDAKIADLKGLAVQISKMAGITIVVNANEEGHLYGSVGPAEVSKGLKVKGMPVDIEMVKMEGHIKETGLYEVKLNLGYDIESAVKVAIVKGQDKK